MGSHPEILEKTPSSGLRGIIFAAFLLASGAGSAFAQGGPYVSSATAVELENGIGKLLSLDYEGSRREFQTVIKTDPESPFGYLFEAGGIWWEASGEYDLFSSTPALQSRFEADIAEAVKRAQAYVDSSDPHRQADGNYAEGMALGTLGQWRLMKHHYLDAYLIGKKAIAHLRKSSEMDEDNNDVLLGLGVFDYQAAHLSGVAKVAKLFGVRGNEARGLKEVQLAMDKSRFSRLQAAQFLLSLELEQRNYDAAAAMTKRLRELLPDSPYYLTIDAILTARAGAFPASQALVRRVYDIAAADPDGFRAKWITLFCSVDFDSCLRDRDARAAADWFERALTLTKSDDPPGYITLLQLFRANAFDIVGRRREAVAGYSAVLDRADFGGAHAYARECAAEACDRNRTLRLLGRPASN